jgi:AcrR family transcriptional regulator
MNERSFINWRLAMRTSGEDTKERIERAAIRAFVRSGVMGASMREIAREAQVSLGAIYNHYPSKEDLAWSLFSRSWAEMGTELRELAKAETGLSRQLRSMIRYVFQSFDQNWQLVTYVYLSRHENLRRVTSDLPNPHLVFKVTVVEAMARGEIPRQDPDVATAMVMGMIVQVIDTKILGRIRQRLTSHVDTVASAACRALGL